MPNISSVTLGFIGFGNMAGAIVDGLLLKQVLPADRIFVCAKDPDKLASKAGARGVIPCADARETAERADLVVIAVKPYLVPDVIAPIREILREKIVVSVAAGLPFAAYEPLLLPGTRHMSTLPNTPVAVGEGVFLCEKRHSLTDEDMALFEALFRPFRWCGWWKRPISALPGRSAAAARRSSACSWKRWATPACSTACRAPWPTNWPRK